MRCLSLADKLAELGHSIEFASRELSYNTNTAITKKQYKLHSLQAPATPLVPTTDVLSWLEVPLAQELNEIEAVVKSAKPDWVIVDHYALGNSWEDSVLKRAPRLLVIDDLFRSHSCTHLLDPNYHPDHAQLWRHKFSRAPQLFLGPEFALLPKHIAALPAHKFSNSVTSILAFFGGSDSGDASEIFIRAWSDLALTGIKATLVIGASNPRAPELLKANSASLEVLQSPNNFHARLSRADLFISAAGSTTWERSYLGVPGLVVTIAENQLPIAKNLHDLDIHEYAGAVQDLTPKAFAQKIGDLVRDSGRRQMFHEKSNCLHVGAKVQALIDQFSL